MATNNIFTVPFRRKRIGKTDYKKRLYLLKSKKLRLVVRKFNKNIVAQLIQYADEGDKVVATVHSKELEKHGWTVSRSNAAAAYLVGLAIGVKAKGQEAILDIGLQTPIKGSKLFAVLKGAVDGGLNVHYSEEILPVAERLHGEHIAKHAALLKPDKEAYQKMFSHYLKSKQDPEKIKELFEAVKKSIMK